MENCKICSNNFYASPDKLVVCDHKGGMVHLGCCTDLCSLDKRPCVHGKAIYVKVTK